MDSHNLWKGNELDGMVQWFGTQKSHEAQTGGGGCMSCISKEEKRVIGHQPDSGKFPEEPGGEAGIYLN